MWVTIKEKSIIAVGGHGGEVHLEFRKIGGSWQKTVHGPGNHEEMTPATQEEINAFLKALALLYPKGQLPINRAFNV